MQVNGVALVLTILRMLKFLDFQKRLGAVTRTVQYAATDLFHFGILFTIVIGGYTVLGFVAFGNAIDGFSSFSNSFETCFQLLMGDLDVSSFLFSHPNEIAAFLYYYSYLVVVYFILLNILLAILVEAYVEVKKEGEFSQVQYHLICLPVSCVLTKKKLISKFHVKSVPQELLQLMKSNVRSTNQYRLSDDEYLSDAEVYDCHSFFNS